MSEEEMKPTREVHGFQCMFCGEIYERKEEAENCWERHIEYTTEPLYNMSDEYPVEILVKKIEGGFYTEIATYVLEKKEKVKLPIKMEVPKLEH